MISCLWTWFTLTKQGGLDVDGSLESFLIVFQALRLLCIILMVPSSFLHLYYYVQQLGSSSHGSVAERVAHTLFPG